MRAKKRAVRFRYGGGVLEFHGRFLLDVQTGKRHPIERGRERSALKALRCAFQEEPRANEPRDRRAR